MNIKIKKENADGIVRLESSGKIKEILIKEDILHPKNAQIELCFMGKNSSGIIELSPKEIEIAYKETVKRLHLLGNVKVMKFEK